MPPPIKNDLLPGKKGVDFHYVSYGGKVYVVYRVQVGPGKFVNMSWKVEKDQYKALGVTAQSARNISKSAFKGLNYFGSSSEIAQGDKDVHPFQQYIRKLKDLHGNVSWLGNKEFMSVMLMGYAENWSAEELRQRLTQTNWYQGRTSYQRSWELDKGEADREADIELWSTRMTEAVRELYGPGMSLDEAGFDKELLKKDVQKLASGVWGSPEDGFATWLEKQRRAAEKIEGSTAWIERQQALEEQRSFMNRPEDVFEQIREEAMRWLGPKGIPDRQTLQGWAEDLVSEKRSDGDFQKFLRQQAKALYPWLGPDEAWQDRASVYKNLMEEELGRSVRWDDGMLYELGGADVNGVPTNTPLSFDEFAVKVRSKPEWWKSARAEEEGFELFNELNSTFNGVEV